MADNKENTGAIFKNEKKSAQSHPDYQGSSERQRQGDGNRLVAEGKQIGDEVLLRVTE